jgi:hypothetical protein
VKAPESYTPPSRSCSTKDLTAWGAAAQMALLPDQRGQCHISHAVQGNTHKQLLHGICHVKYGLTAALHNIPPCMAELCMASQRVSPPWDSETDTPPAQVKVAVHQLSQCSCITLLQRRPARHAQHRTAQHSTAQCRAAHASTQCSFMLFAQSYSCSRLSLTPPTQSAGAAFKGSPNPGTFYGAKNKSAGPTLPMPHW